MISSPGRRDKTSMAGNVGIGLFLFLFLLALPIVLLMVVGFVMLAHQPMIGVILLVAGGIAWLWYMTISAAMHTVFMAAVYQFATSEQVPDGFEQHAMANAFRSK
jgi:hypothetical protein